MKEKEKQLYCSPEVEVLLLQSESVVCTSDLVTDSITVMGWSTGSDFPVNF